MTSDTAAPTTLRQLREQRQLTQTELARLADVSQSTIAKWELGVRCGTADRVQRASAALGVTMEEFTRLLNAAKEGTFTEI